jgi:hypothetical protein
MARLRATRGFPVGGHVSIASSEMLTMRKGPMTEASTQRHLGCHDVASVGPTTDATRWRSWKEGRFVSGRGSRDTDCPASSSTSQHSTVASVSNITTPLSPVRAHAACAYKREKPSCCATRGQACGGYRCSGRVQGWGARLVYADACCRMTDKFS